MMAVHKASRFKERARQRVTFMSFSTIKYVRMNDIDYRTRIAKNWKNLLTEIVVFLQTMSCKKMGKFFMGNPLAFWGKKLECDHNRASK
jgi:hypothetical protein